MKRTSSSTKQWKKHSYLNLLLSHLPVHRLFVTLKMNYQVNCSLSSNDIVTSGQCCLPTGCQMTTFTCTTMHCCKFHFKVWACMFWELFHKHIFGGGLLWLKGQTHVTCELQSAPSADPIWLYLQWCYEVWTSPQRLQGEGRWYIEEGHNETVESWIAGDQSIIAPVALYWLCSPTGLRRSMRFQTFCVGRWGSVPGLTLTF